ncbi:MAG: SulP family inorganic anion transporter [Halanaerobiales bacterium]
MKRDWYTIRGDIIGGLTAAVVALPLALAFGIASGAGAVAGLYASIFGGLVAAIFGGCGVQITGPTGAMTAVLISIVARHGVEGMFLAGALAGLLQILAGLFKTGKLVRYLPQPVIAGFTNGVAILFFLTALDDALATISITLITVLVLLISLKFFKKLPESLFGLLVGLLVNELFIHSSHVVGDLPFHIPRLTLGSISALLSAEVTDKMVGDQHDSNRELLGQGLGNLVSSLVGGVPVTGAVARSGINVHSGGRTRLSGVLHSIFLLLMVLVFAPVVRRIPLASLAAILMVASVRTADWKSIRLLPRARWTYGGIMIITTVLTVVMDLAVAVIVGVILSAIVALFDLAHLPEGRKTEGKISLHGPLLFVGVEKLKEQLEMNSEKGELVLDFAAVSHIDESGALALQELLFAEAGKGRKISIDGLREEPLRVLERMGIKDKLDRSGVILLQERGGL